MNFPPFHLLLLHVQHGTRSRIPRHVIIIIATETIANLLLPLSERRRSDILKNEREESGNYEITRGREDGNVVVN